jgi:RNA polymerase sigma-54 factor
MKQGLALRAAQHLALTPQLQQSIRLLQLSTLELQQEVDQMLDDNPFLECDDEAAERDAFGLDSADAPSLGSIEQMEPSHADEPLVGDLEPGWDGDGCVELAPDDSEWGGDAQSRGALVEADRADADQWVKQYTSLQDHLHDQVIGLRLSGGDRAALDFLIESLNEDGYLEDTLESLALGLAPNDPLQQEEVLGHLQLALRLLQSFEPSGVGARHLRECLRLQLQTLEPRQPAHALSMRLCHQPLELLLRRDVRRLSQLCAASETEVRAAMALIAKLDPKPGRRFAYAERLLVVPDVLVVRIGSAQRPLFKVQLNPDVMPRLRVHDVYANALKGYKTAGQEAGNLAALQQRLKEARWFIRNIQQRFDTILRVSHAIVERQHNFFVHGELAMRPLVLREIADEIGMHESTISRVTTAKYMATPFGIFELKHFFGPGLETDSGSPTSSTAVRALIRQLVEAERNQKPLSDKAISEILKAQGIECARRTVAKYREFLRIAPAHLRKSV